MAWLAYGVVIFIGFYSSQRSSISPSRKYFWGFGGEPEVCEEISPLKRVEKGIVRRGKMAGYTSRGESICYKNIFEPGERAPEVKLIADAVKAKASEAANKIFKITTANPLDQSSIYIDISAIKNYQIAKYLYHTFAVEIANHKPVVRQKPVNTKFHTLKVELAPTASKEELLLLKFSVPSKKSEQISKWMIL